MENHVAKKFLIVAGFSVITCFTDLLTLFDIVQSKSIYFCNNSKIMCMTLDFEGLVFTDTPESK